jgi:dihydroorotate dehydrogenase
MDAERAHDIGMSLLRSGMASTFGGIRPLSDDDRDILRTELLGMTFSNPLGMAAGFDKNGVAVEQLARLGFGFVEVGTVTLWPQAGNERPRLFRLPGDRALINRLGFNNEGAEAVAKRLEGRKYDCVVGINIGKNRDVPIDNAVENYVECLKIVHSAADYIAVNVSSPNTPGLRSLQAGEHLAELLSGLQQENAKLGMKPLLVKIAPDLTDEEIREIVDVCKQYGVSGMIATNTTLSRQGISSDDPNGSEEGGLSGMPLRSRSDAVIDQIYRLSGGSMPVVGVGGVFSAEDAMNKITRGASLVQMYTGFVYGGPSLPSYILRGLAKHLKKIGLGSVSEAVGTADRDAGRAGV